MTRLTLLSAEYTETPICWHFNVVLTYIHKQHTYIYEYTHRRTYTHTYIHTYIHAYIHTYIHTYIHYIHTYIHTYIHKNIPTYKHTYIHTGMNDELFEMRFESKLTDWRKTCKFFSTGLIGHHFRSSSR